MPVSREVWKQAGELGMLGVTVPEKYGGSGLDALYAAVHWEEQMYAGTSGPGILSLSVSLSLSAFVSPTCHR